MKNPLPGKREYANRRLTGQEKNSWLLEGVPTGTFTGVAVIGIADARLAPDELVQADSLPTVPRNRYIPVDGLPRALCRDRLVAGISLIDFPGHALDLKP